MDKSGGAEKLLGHDGIVTTLQLKIINERGLHARASAKFAATVDKFRSSVEVSRNGLVVPGNSIMGLLTLAAEKGMTLSLRITGDDANEVALALIELTSNFFGEGR